MIRFLRFALSIAALCLGLAACAGGSSADGSTSWLSSCEKSSECRRGLSCICGKCTRACDTSRACYALGTDAVCDSVSVIGGACASGVDTAVCVRGSSGSAAADASASVGTAPTGTAPGITSSPPSAAPDGASPDRGVSCTDDQECNDGQVCNGRETCVAGPGGKACQRGMPVDDGTFCGEDSVCMAGVCRALSQCNLSGNWAMKIVANVTWKGSQVVDGQGEIDQWALLKIDQPSGEVMFLGSLRPCGLAFPDFHSVPDLGDETHGITFDPSAFDSPSIAPAVFPGKLTNPGSGTTFEGLTSTTMLGIEVTSGTGEWPASSGMLTRENGFNVVDVDRDGFPGITANMKTGMVPGSATPYADIIWDVGNAPLQPPERATKLRLAIRSTATETGRLETCSQVSGEATVTIDHHVVGCFPGSATAACSAEFVDVGRPVYTTTSATFVAVRMDAQETCSAVRTTLP